MKLLIGVVMILATFVTFEVQAADGFAVLRVSTPLIASGSYIVRLGDSGGSLRPAMQAEAGIGGGRLAVGLDNTGEKTIGYGVKAAILRTWFEPIDVERDQTFLGVDIELSVKRLILNAGGYRRISDGDDDWIVSAGLGFVF